jgi:hypothetical protein
MYDATGTTWDLLRLPLLLDVHIMDCPIRQSIVGCEVGGVKTTAP